MHDPGVMTPHQNLPRCWQISCFTSLYFNPKCPFQAHFRHYYCYNAAQPTVIRSHWHHLQFPSLLSIYTLSAQEVPSGIRTLQRHGASAPESNPQPCSSQPASLGMRSYHSSQSSAHVAQSKNRLMASQGTIRLSRGLVYSASYFNIKY